jgi:hypothetical protein
MRTCETCRYISKLHGTDDETLCWSCIRGNEMEDPKHLHDNWHPVAQIPCGDCGIEEGIWEITILPQFRDNFGEDDDLYCDKCLVLALTGYHSGGGLTADVIEKIVRKRIVE